MFVRFASHYSGSYLKHQSLCLETVAVSRTKDKRRAASMTHGLVTNMGKPCVWGKLSTISRLRSSVGRARKPPRVELATKRVVHDYDVGEPDADISVAVNPLALGRRAPPTAAI